MMPDWRLKNHIWQMWGGLNAIALAEPGSERVRLSAVAGTNIGQYMQLIQRIPLLDKQMEQDLATLVQAGRVAEEDFEKLLAQYGSYRKIPKRNAKYAGMWRKIRVGDEARARLVYHNLRFAAYVARHSMGWNHRREFVVELDEGVSGWTKHRQLRDLDRFAGNSLPLADRIQAANIGLIMAADNYFPNSGAKFVTYASFHIFKELHAAFVLEASRDGLSRTQAAGLVKVQAAQRKLRRLGGYEPSARELASDTELGPLAVEFRLEEDRICSANTLEGEAADTAVRDRSTGAWLGLKDILWDDSVPDPYEVCLRVSLLEHLEKTLGNLSEREAGVISLRFGLRGFDPRSLDEVGMVYGVSRERIRQIERKALEKLRHPEHSRPLRGYIHEGWFWDEREALKAADHHRKQTITVLTRPDLYPEWLRPKEDD